MQQLTQSLAGSIQYLGANAFKIIVGGVIILVFYLIYYASTYSLKKLKIGVFSSYPFSLFFPEGTTWSIGYFLLVVLLLGLLVYLGFQGKLFFGPA